MWKHFWSVKSGLKSTRCANRRIFSHTYITNRHIQCESAIPFSPILRLHFHSRQNSNIPFRQNDPVCVCRVMPRNNFLEYTSSVCTLYPFDGLYLVYLVRSFFLLLSQQIWFVNVQCTMFRSRNAFGIGLRVYYRGKFHNIIVIIITINAMSSWK